MLIAIPSFSFAASNNLNQNVTSITDNDLASFDLEVEKFVPRSYASIEPFATFKGNAGSVSLDYMQSAKALQTTYRLYHTTVSNFVGEIKIYTAKGKKYKGMIPVSMFSPMRTATNFIPKSLKLKRGSMYTAYITGKAAGTGITGSRVAKVVPKAHINFKY